MARAVADFQEGRDREASFRLLYESYQPALLRFFRRKGVSPEDAFDLTQESFLGIYRGLEAYTHSDRFEGWIYRIAETCLLKRVRAASTAKRSAIEISSDRDDFSPVSHAVPDRQLNRLLATERSQQLRDAIRSLPDQMRKCLTLRLYHELSYREIAVVLRLSVETVKVHLSRARARLKELLADLDFELPGGP